MTTTDEAITGVDAGPSAATVGTGAVDDSGPSEAGSASTHSWRGVVVAAGGYLLVSIVVWWSVWTSHPTSTTTCGCGDTSLFTWFLDWPAYAAAHGLNPLYSTAMHVPYGVNLLANTSVLAVGVPLIPVTWLFGPVASLNVALTLAPALSALAMFVLLRRWVTWSPAAFVGGLFYGFSPFVLVSLTDAHLMLGLAVVPPLVVACLDELLLRQRRRAVPMGVGLGFLVFLQFFIGTEVLLIMVTMGVIGLVLVTGWAAWRHTRAFRVRVRHALVGLATAVGTAVVLLLFPAWYALEGPGHFSGSIWPGLIGNITRKQDTNLNYYAFGSPRIINLITTLDNHVYGGYQGTTLSYQYFGIGILVVLALGVAIWRHDRRLWLFGSVGIVSVLFSLGTRESWGPWRLVDNRPLLENIVPYRFVLITYLVVGVMLGLILEHVYLDVNRWFARAGAKGATAQAPETRTTPRRWAGAAVAAVVAVAALAQPVAYLSKIVPMTTNPVDLPTWFTTVAPSLHGHQVFLVLPAPFTSYDNSMTWQAVDDMSFTMVGEGGPGGIQVRAGYRNTYLQTAGAALADVSSPSEVATPITRNDISAVRQALHYWRVTTVILPDQPSLPQYDRVSSVPAAAALITAATGHHPIHQAGALVWTGVTVHRP
jgi:hypothetical protein